MGQKVMWLPLALLAITIPLAFSNKVYDWKTIAFKDLPRNENSTVNGNPYYIKENVVMTGFDYDPRIGYICAGFARSNPGIPATVGCFSVEEFGHIKNPEFSAFPTYSDNDLPDWPKLRQRYKKREAGEYDVYDEYDEYDEPEISSRKTSYTPLRDLFPQYRSFKVVPKNEYEQGRILSYFKKDSAPDKKVVVVIKESGEQHRPSHYNGGDWRPEHSGDSHPPRQPIPGYYIDESSEGWSPYPSRTEKPEVVDDKKKNKLSGIYNKLNNKFSSISNYFHSKKEKIPNVEITYVQSNIKPSHYLPDHSGEYEWHQSERPYKRPYRPNYHGDDDDDDYDRFERPGNGGSFQGRPRPPYREHLDENNSGEVWHYESEKDKRRPSEDRIPGDKKPNRKGGFSSSRPYDFDKDSDDDFRSESNNWQVRQEHEHSPHGQRPKGQSRPWQMEEEDDDDYSNQQVKRKPRPPNKTVIRPSKPWQIEEDEVQNEPSKAGSDNGGSVYHYKESVNPGEKIEENVESNNNENNGNNNNNRNNSNNDNKSNDNNEDNEERGTNGNNDNNEGNKNRRFQLRHNLEDYGYYEVETHDLRSNNDFYRFDISGRRNQAPQIPKRFLIPSPLFRKKEQEDEFPNTPERNPESPKIEEPYNFISVHRPRFDDCGRLWFIDTGSLEYESGPIFYHKPTLWAFEVSTDIRGNLINRPYLRYELSDSSALGLETLVVDIHDQCENYHVYIPNYRDSEIIVYSGVENTHWIFEHSSMEPILAETDFKFKDVEYSFLGGVYSVTLGPRDRAGFRDLYFAPASGTGEFKINTEMLQDKSFTPNYFSNEEFRFLGYRGFMGLTSSQVYDPNTKVIFFASPTTHTIKCWNTRKPLTPDSYGTVFSDRNMSQGWEIQLDQKGNLWLLANNYNVNKEVGLKPEESNFVIYRISAKDAIKRTKCDLDRRGRSLDKVENVPEEPKEDNKEKQAAVEAVPAPEEKPQNGTQITEQPSSNKLKTEPLFIVKPQRAPQTYPYYPNNQIPVAVVLSESA